MYNGGKVNLNEKTIKVLNKLSSNSHSKTNRSPKLSSYSLLNNLVNLKRNLKSSSKRNLQFPNYKTFYHSSNNFYTPSSSQHYNVPIISKNEGEEEIIQKMKELINQREKQKEQRILNEYYTHNYLELMKKRIDNNPNGINLSISNCKTQYPINYINDDEFYRKLKLLLEQYESNKNDISINNLNNSCRYSTMLNNLNNIKVKYMNDELEDELNTFRNTYRPDNNFEDHKFVNKSHHKNNKTCFNFYKNKKNQNEYEGETNDDELNLSCEENSSSLNIGENNNCNDICTNKSKNKLMSIIDNKHKNKKENENKNDKNENKTEKQTKYKKNIIYKNKVIGKNLFQEYELQENYISKMKSFIQYLEGLYILSFTNSFKYFIEKLKSYKKPNLIGNKDSINLLKRFQKSNKSKNKNKKINKNILYNTNNISLNKDFIYRNINNNTFTSNSSAFIETYKNKNKKKVNNCISPNIYVPKNNTEKYTLSRNKSNTNNSLNFKNINQGINSNISNNTRYTDKKINISNENNSKKIFSSNKKNIIIKYRNDNFSYSKDFENENNRQNDNQNLSNLINSKISPNISSFSKKSKEDILTDFNFTDQIYMKQKPIIYIKPKQGTTNLKKILLSNEKEINDKNDLSKSEVSIKHLYKTIIKNKTENVFNDLNKTTNNKKVDMSNSLLIKKINSQRSPIKPKFIFKNDIFRNANKFISNNEGTRDNSENSKNITKEIIVKNICSYDKKVWVSIKYIISETSKQEFSKIKVRKRLISLKDNKNIFLNCDIDSLKPVRTDSIELISPLSLLNAHIENNNENDNINESNNLNITSDNNSQEKIEKIIDILQNYEKQNISYFSHYFFDLLKAQCDSNLLFSSQNDIFKDIKKNFENTDSDIFNISNNMNTNEVDKNNSSDKDDRSNNNKKDLNNSKTLQVKCKRKLFSHRRNLRLMSDDDDNDNDTKNNERENKLNKSLDERIDSLENERMNLNISGNYFPRKTKSFRLKITRCKILRETIQKKSKIINLKADIKRNVLNDEKDMRKKNVLTLLLTNKFSPSNNNLRLIRNYFQFWKLKNNKDESDMSKNNRNDINNLNSENIIKENENNLVNYEELKINDIIENNIIKEEINSDKLSLNDIDIIKNEKEPQINSIREYEENSSKEIHFDANELEEKIEYLRIFLINYIFRKSISSDEENEEEKIQ